MAFDNNYNSWVEINFENLAYNVERIKSLLEPNCEIMGVVKSNAYGHGAVEIAKFLINECGISQLALATLCEGIELRNAGINVPLLVFGVIPNLQLEQAVNYDLTIALFRIDTAKNLSEIAKKLDKNAKVHIKIESGLGRIGVRPGEELQELINTIKELSGLDIEGAFTHFSESGAIDKSYTFEQLSKFQDGIRQLQDNDIKPKYLHCANTQAILEVPESHSNLVRAGKAIYGYHGMDHEFSKINLRPILQWKTTIGHIKYVFPGESLGYSRTYTADSKRKIATLPFGFGDGYSSLLSNKGHVIIKGKKAPVVGRICMDQCLVDVTDIEDVGVGDIVTILGVDGKEKIGVMDLSKLTGLQPTEIVSSIGRRVERTYISKNRIATSY